MKTRHTQNKGKKTGAILCGISICALTFLAVMLLFSAILCLTKDPLSNSDKFAPLAFAAAGIPAGMIGRRALCHNKIFLFCPVLLLLTALLIGLFLSDGKISPSALLSEITYLGTCYLSFFISKARTGRQRRRR